MRMTTMAVLIVASGYATYPVHAQPQERYLPKTTEDGSWVHRNVKTRTQFYHSHISYSYTGEVLDIDNKGMTLRCVGGWRSEDRVKPKDRVLRPIDVLSKGEVIEYSGDADSYCWQDVKKGDTVSVDIVHDIDDKEEYCILIRIDARPKGKIPASQKPNKRGVPYHVSQNIKNDIQNGLDVDEDEIVKAFPFKRHLILPNQAVKPDSLSDEYRQKLEANRERIAKEKELKAKSTDPKKADKK